MKREDIDVLLVEDDGVLGGAVAQRLRIEGISTQWAQTLTEKLLEAYGSRSPLAPFSLSGDARKALVAHHWPGNINELTNRIVQACTLAERSELGASDLFPEIDPLPASPPSLSQTRADAERDEIERVIAECGGRIGEAAKRLGISRTTLWKKRRQE